VRCLLERREPGPSPLKIDTQCDRPSDPYLSTQGLVAQTKDPTIIEFPSREAAENWYASPEYEAVHHLRLEATSAGSLVFLDGFEIPTGTGKEDPGK